MRPSFSHFMITKFHSNFSKLYNIIINKLSDSLFYYALPSCLFSNRVAPIDAFSLVSIPSILELE